MPHRCPQSAVEVSSPLTDAVAGCAPGGSRIGPTSTSGGAPTRCAEPTGNILLDGLPWSSLQALRPLLDEVALPVGRVVARPDEPVGLAWFPVSGVFAEVVHLSNGATVEVNLIGREGMAGLPPLLGTDRVPTAITTLVGGSFLCAPARALVGRSAVDCALATRLLRYAQAVLSVRAYSIVCDRLHTVQARLARWLLKTGDRLATDELTLTQDDLALMLGVSRPSITVNALAFQEAGLIRYHRGRIRIVDRAGLEAAACECYGAIREEFERLLGWRVGQEPVRDQDAARG